MLHANYCVAITYLFNLGVDQFLVQLRPFNAGLLTNCYIFV